LRNILDKLDIGMKFFIIAVFGIAIIYCILSVVFGLFQDENIGNKVDINDIEQYITIYSDETGESETDTSKIVKDYSTYYTIESAVKNFIQALVDEDYAKTYNILSEELKEKYSKKEYLSNIEKFTKDNFIHDESLYEVDYCLNKVYNLSNFMYLCECNTVNDVSVKIGLKLDTSNKTYTVFYIDFE